MSQSNLIVGADYHLFNGNDDINSIWSQFSDNDMFSWSFHYAYHADAVKFAGITWWQEHDYSDDVVGDVSFTNNKSDVSNQYVNYKQGTKWFNATLEGILSPFQSMSFYAIYNNSAKMYDSISIKLTNGLINSKMKMLYQTDHIKTFDKFVPTSVKSSINYL
jgi:hypothetical protein